MRVATSRPAMELCASRRSWTKRDEERDDRDRVEDRTDDGPLDTPRHERPADQTDALTDPQQAEEQREDQDHAEHAHERSVRSRRMRGRLPTFMVLLAAVMWGTTGTA